MSQQPQCWGIRAETHAKTSVNVLESVTPDLNLCVFQNQVASTIVPAAILELVGPITIDPVTQEILQVAWFSPCPVLCTVRLSRMVLGDCFLQS